ncbi:enterobactin synthase subunit F [Actinoplanes lobatus]|uniref:Enterobactin synthase subunit F n=1 Tax=Actinoplanes lobatus TaxID=113568 RepID=A0A7W7MJH6_9ACTN|nr:non-ribosomal peptide synthetase [Actinoplanes lobatus]MBB4752085.1 enterobactin synthetase component F [Actinoplanes lobatus]GGN98839.1 enterobactin synthase subunit F [Actinoplanes lobatus]GIE46220.1 enterobactin synthase subunit F [Actinoplanes lobatus]
MRSPLTIPQQALWFAQLLDPANPGYLCAHRIDLDDTVDPDRLAAAIRQVTAATDALHTGFAATGDGVRRIRVPAGGPERVRVADVDEWIAADLERAIPLTGEPLVRQALLHTGDGRTVWYFRAHHLLLDGYGFAMVTKQIAAVYRNPATVTDFRTHDDLVAAEHDYPARDQDRAYWLARLDGAPEPVTLTKRPAPLAHHNARRHIELPADEFLAAADRFGVTWAEVAYAITALYLHRITGATDLILGAPLSGRLGTVAAAVPSSVVNVLPLRLPVPPGSTVRDLVAAVRTELRASARHQRYRYEWLQRDLGLVGTGRRMFGPQINIKPFPRTVDLGPGAGARVHYLATGPADDFEVTVGWDADTGRIDLTVDANPDAYSPAELDGHFTRLAALFGRAGTLDPDTPAATVDVLTDAERELVLHTWNDTAHDVPDTTLTRLLVAQAARTPRSAAVRAQGQQISYEQLHARAERLAWWLTARGAGPGRLVAVALPRGVDLMVALLGVLRSGAGYLPLDLSYPADRLAFMVEDARPVVVLREIPELDGVPREVLEEAGPDDPAYAIYTSGSTGRPKGVLVPHRGIVNRLLWMQHEYGLTGGERVLQKTPSGFDVSVWEFFWPLITGATLVMAKPEGHRDPAYLAGLIVDEKVTTCHFVPSMLRVFLAEPSAADTAGTLRRVICSGEELPEDLARIFHRVVGCELHNLYGPTEASVDVTYWPCSPQDPPGPVPIGRPVWNTRIHLLDAGGRPVPPGVPGELHIAGRQLATGYLNRPELTAERFRPGPFDGTRLYRTGDLALWRPDGAIEFLGRTDGQVKIRGFRVELGEIEAVLTEHPTVARAAVAVVSGRLVAYVVGSLTVAECRDHLAPRLPEHMIPATVVPMTDLPLTPSGKLDRRALPAPAPAATGDVPRTPAENAIAELVAEVLGGERPGPHDNFFELGGHSLHAATLVQRIRAELGVVVPLAAVFGTPTVAGLAARLTGGPASAGEGLDVLLPLRQADGAALFLVHPAGGLSWCYTGILPHLDPSIAVYGLQSRALAGPGPDMSLVDTAADYLREIRKVRPQGPYGIAGWSVGGVLAQEIAAALAADGEQVRVLGLLDAYPSDQWRDLPAPTAADASRALLFMAGQQESSVAGPLTTASVVDALRKADSPLAELGEQVLSAIPAVVAGNARMMRDHEHRLFVGDTVMFVAAAPRAEDWLDAGGWRPYLDGDFTIVDLDCTHPGMVSPASLAVVGRELNRYLAENDGEAEPVS